MELGAADALKKFKYGTADCHHAKELFYILALPDMERMFIRISVC
jgi:hypothetical protein